MMNLESQRKAIAKACGYTPLQLEEDDALPGRYGQAFDGWKTPEGNPTTILPNYPEDLNAMHAAMNTQPPAMKAAITQKLVDIMREQDSSFLVRAINATAPQRAEAFLKAWGLWEEAPASLDSENA